GARSSWLRAPLAFHATSTSLLLALVDVHAEPAEIVVVLPLGCELCSALLRAVGVRLPAVTGDQPIAIQRVDRVVHFLPILSEDQVHPGRLLVRIQPDHAGATVLPSDHGEFVVLDDEAPLLLPRALFGEHHSLLFATYQHPPPLEFLQIPLGGIFRRVFCHREEHHDHSQAESHRTLPSSDAGLRCPYPFRAKRISLNRRTQPVMATSVGKRSMLEAPKKPTMPS